MISRASTSLVRAGVKQRYFLSVLLYFIGNNNNALSDLRSVECNDHGLNQYNQANASNGATEPVRRQELTNHSGTSVSVGTPVGYIAQVCD